MEQQIRDLFPEISWIENVALQKMVVDTYVMALDISGWEPEDMNKIPFTLLIPNCPFSYRDHVRGVVRIAKAAMDQFNEMFASKDSLYTLDADTLIAGALLHDVGKILEYEKKADGTVVKSGYGQDLRHPFSGTALALQNGCSSRIAHIIATHAKEGDGTLRSPEAVVVNKADFISFDTAKAFLGMK